jgi:hypothetical protein
MDGCATAGDFDRDHLLLGADSGARGAGRHPRLVAWTRQRFVSRYVVADRPRVDLNGAYERHLAASEEAFVVDGKGEIPGRPLSAEAVGTLVAFYDTDGFVRRRYSVVQRLHEIHDSTYFATLPEDLRERIREIVAATQD